MQTRGSSTINALRAFSRKSEKLRKSLRDAGLVTNTGLLLLPATLLNYATCENAWIRAKRQNEDINFLTILDLIFIQDLPIFIFNTTLLSTFIVLPIMRKSFNLVRQSCTMDSSDVVLENTEKTVLSEVIEKIEGGINLLQSAATLGVLVERFPLPNNMRHPLLLVSVIPFIQASMQKMLTDFEYPSLASWPAFKEALPDRLTKAKFLSLLEALRMSFTLAGAVAAFVSTFIDFFINSRLENDYPYTNQIILGFAALGGLIGLLSIFNKNIYKMAAQMASVFTTFFLVANPIVSEFLCINPEKFENWQTFDKNSLSYVSLISAGSFLVSLLDIFDTKFSVSEKLDIQPSTDLNEKSLLTTVGIFSSPLTINEVHQSNETSLKFES